MENSKTPEESIRGDPELGHLQEGSCWRLLVLASDLGRRPLQLPALSLRLGWSARWWTRMKGSRPGSQGASRGHQLGEAAPVPGAPPSPTRAERHRLSAGCLDRGGRVCRVPGPG